MSETHKEIIETVCKFLPAWKELEAGDISVSSFSGGYVNTLWLVSLPEDSVITPRTVLYRVYGGNYLPRDLLENWSCLLTEEEEVLIAYEHGKRGWGPKIFGIFPGGRIEEFIPSHTLTCLESENLDIATDIARAYARFHSMDLPLEKNRLKRLGRSFNHDKLTYFKDFDPDFPFESPTDLNELLAFPLDHELKWVHFVAEQITCKKALLTLDTNFSNILIREDNEPKKLKAVLVDYEVAVYGNRGVDIGGHFACRFIDRKDEAYEEKGLKESGIQYPKEEFRRMFIRQYLQELETLNPKIFNEDGLDSEEHLLMESDLGSLTYALYRLQFTFKICDLLRHPNIFFLLPLFINFYKEYKKLFIDKYKWPSILPQERNCWLPVGLRKKSEN